MIAWPSSVGVVPAPRHRGQSSDLGPSGWLETRPWPAHAAQVVWSETGFMSSIRQGGRVFVVDKNIVSRMAGVDKAEFAGGGDPGERSEATYQVAPLDGKDSIRTSRLSSAQE
jgi:hypothetical protein